MIIKINSYYKNEIDKAKEGFVDENYKLKSPYFFVGIYFLCLIYELTLLAEGVTFPTVLLYATPLLIGAIYELFLLRDFKKDTISSKTVECILKTVVIRMTNILFLIMCIFLIAGKSIIPKILYSKNNIETINMYLIYIYLIFILIFIMMFFIGYMIEKKQVQKGKIKVYYPAAIISASAILGFFILRNLSYAYIIIITIIMIILLCYSIGKIYFRYKFYNQKINDTDKIIDYKL